MVWWILAAVVVVVGAVGGLTAHEIDDQYIDRKIDAAISNQTIVTAQNYTNYTNISRIDFVISGNETELIRELARERFEYCMLCAKKSNQVYYVHCLRDYDKFIFKHILSKMNTTEH